MTDKALENNVQNLIVSRIHRAYTVACDELFGRGYLSQDERKAIGGQIGELLGAFIKGVDPALAERMVEPADVEAVVETKENTEKANPIWQAWQTVSDFITGKAGARHSTSDREDIQTVHDIAVKQGAECRFEVKEVGGKHRWVLYSSSAYKDRDGEIISQKAHEADIARMDATGDYGVLRWWHVGAPHAEVPGDWRTYKAGPGWDLGRCDFAAMHGRIRVESGTFYNERVGAAVKAAGDKLDASLGFAHPLDEPAADGGFDNIGTFERSILEQGFESNPYADLPLILRQKEKGMDKPKQEKMTELLGDEAAQLILAGAEASQKAADEAGVKFKELAPDEPEPVPEGEPEAAPAEEPKVGDMTLTALKDFIVKCMAEYDMAKSTKAAGELTAFKAEAVGKINQVVERLNDQGKKIKALAGDLPSQLGRAYRASEADDTVKEKEAAGAGPQADPFTAFDSFMGLGAQNGAQVAGTPPVPPA